MTVGALHSAQKTGNFRDQDTDHGGAPPNQGQMLGCTLNRPKLTENLDEAESYA